MSAPGAEGIGGGSPEWRAPADQAPTSPGYDPGNEHDEEMPEDPVRPGGPAHPKSILADYHSGQPERADLSGGPEGQDT